jgi:flagellin
MALVINHNLPAMTAARNLGLIYNRLSKNIARLSSGLRINAAGDDPAGLAMREMLKGEIAAGFQGVRNLTDAISLMETTEGALESIGKKLVRMKELATQASSGALIDSLRVILNSEYQAMAAEIDAIAGRSNFNGIKLLDGTLNKENGGRGLMIHFGSGATPGEDYYFVKTGDARATSTSGFKIAGDGKNDIWSAGPYGAQGGCCGGIIMDLGSISVSGQGQAFAYGYNWDGNAAGETALLTSKYLAGRYGNDVGTTYSELIDNINQGTQSRLIVEMSASFLANNTGSDYVALVLDSKEVYFVGDSANVASITAGKIARQVSDSIAIRAQAFATAVNTNTSSQYWAMVSGTERLIVFRKDGGNNNHLSAEEMISNALDDERVTFINAQTGSATSAVGNFSLGGEYWGTMVANKQKGGGYSIVLLGRDIGNGKDLFIAGGTLLADTNFTLSLTNAGIAASNVYINTLTRSSFTEVQDAADAPWVGAEIRTIESASRSLEAVEDAIERNAGLLANVGAAINRLNGTMDSLIIQVENQQLAEARISDVDIAKEITQLTKNQILANLAASMLAQANGLGELALILIKKW